MAQKKDEAQGAPERMAQQAGKETARGAEQAGRTSADVLRMGQQEMNRAAELGRAQSEQFGRMFSASLSAYRDLSDWSGKDLSRFTSTQACVARGLQEMGWELMRFTQDTLRSGMRTANDMVKCRSVEDIAALQRDFVREAMDQWLDGSVRMLRIGSDTASEAIDELQSAAAKVDEIGRRGAQRMTGEDERPRPQ